MLLYYARHALRLLVREPGFTMAALLTLALGVGANVAVFAVVEAVLLRPLPYVDADRLAIVKHRDQRTGFTKQDVAMGDFVDLAARQSVFESMAGYGSGQGLVFGLGDPFRVSTLGAGPGLLDTLRVRPVLGRLLQPADSRPGAAPVIVLGYELWQSRFGSDPNIVGRGVKLGPRERQVVGVAPEGFRFPPGADRGHHRADDGASHRACGTEIRVVAVCRGAPEAGHLDRGCQRQPGDPLDGAPTASTRAAIRGRNISRCRCATRWLATPNRRCCCCWPRSVSSC